MSRGLGDVYKRQCVADYKNLIVNGNNTNVQLMSNQIPTISETTIKFDVGLVDG